MAGRVDIKLFGRPLETRLPPLLMSASRTAAGAADPFLPPGYLTPVSAFDLSAGARSAADAGELQHGAGADEIVVLELADGSTLITSAERLRDSLRHSRPELLGANDEILLDKLREAIGADRSGLTKA